MRPLSISSLLLVCCLQLCACAYVVPDRSEPAVIQLDRLSSHRLPYTLVTERPLAEGGYLPCDLDGDFADELLHSDGPGAAGRRETYLLAESLDPNIAWFQNVFQGNIGTYCVGDVDGDGMNDILVSETCEDTTWLHLLNSSGRTLLKHAAAVKPAGYRHTWQTLVRPHGLTDVNDDGRPDLIYSVQTGIGYQPRTIAALDIQKNKLIWNYETGMYTAELLLHDIDGDGRKELLIGSNATDNAPESPAQARFINGADDRSTCLTVLSAEGKLLSSQVLGGVYSSVNVYLHDLDGDGLPEIPVVFTSHSVRRESSFLALWNPRSASISQKKIIEKHSSRHMGFADFDRDGRTDFIMGWDDGTIEVRNSRFDVIRSVLVPDFTSHTFLVSDLDNDGEEEVIVSGTYLGTAVSLILNRQLRPLAYTSCSCQLKHVVNAGFGSEKLLLGTEMQAAGSISMLYALRKRSPALPQVPLAVLAAGLAAGLLLAWLVYRFHGRRRRESELRDLRQGMIEALGMPALLLSHDGTLAAANQRARVLFTLPAAAAAGASYSDILSEDCWQEAAALIDESLQHRTRPVQQELSVQTGGDQRDLILFVEKIHFSGGAPCLHLVLFFDVTELSRSRRAVAWASMAQRLAHEIKTPLSTVTLSVQHLQMECEDVPEISKKLDKYIRRIIQQISRLQKLTDSFLQFSRIEPPRVEPADMNTLVREWLQENSFKFGADITLVTALAQGLPGITADIHQLKIVIGNIMENGLKAMQGRGVLTVTTRLVQSLQVKNTVMPLEGVQLEITDTGHGISEADFRQLFKPFFSRSPGGTGLGLVITKKIVEDHHGTITLESEKDIGTRVCVTIPA